MRVAVVTADVPYAASYIVLQVQALTQDGQTLEVTTDDWTLTRGREALAYFEKRQGLSYRIWTKVGRPIAPVYDIAPGRLVTFRCGDMTLRWQAESETPRWRFGELTTRWKGRIR